MKYRIFSQNEDVDIEAKGAEEAAELWAESGLRFEDEETKQVLYVARVLDTGELTEYCKVLVQIERVYKATRTTD